MDSSKLAYVQSLIGTPWERKGRHCWWLVQDVQKHVYGREIPFGDATTVPTRERRKLLLSLPAEAYGWREVPAPEDGAVVRMYCVGGNPADLEHAGVYLAIDGGGVLHTNAPHGVTFESILELEKMRSWKCRFFVPNTGVSAK